MQFAKLQGLGNDFIVINCLQEKIAEQEYSELALKMCDRHFGVGADGILLVLPSEKSDIQMRVINSDGSEAEMCGNGIRCFARYVYEEKIVIKKEMTVETLAGIMIPKIITDEEDRVRLIEVDMGVPLLAKEEIPMVDVEQTLGAELEIEGQAFTVTAVSMGNPHCVIFVDDIKQADLEYWGPRIEKSAYFPQKTNVEFVQVLDEGEVIMRVWERGAAITMACGTGSCATTVACVLNGRTGRNVLLHLDGGDLQVRWDENNGHLYMTGAAENVFRGIW